VSVLDRKLARELRAQWGMISAITGIIVVGVACLVAMGSAYNNLNEAKKRYYAQCRMADFTIDLKKVPVAELAAVADLPGVTEIRPRIQFQATVDIADVEEPLNGTVISLPDREEATINDIVMKWGGYFSDTRENEVIVSEAFAEKHALRPGSRIHLLLNNRRQELHVVGTAISSEFVYMLGPGALTPDPKRYGAFYVKQSYAEDVFDFDGAANQVSGKLAPTVRERPKALLQRIERMLAPYGVATVTPLADQASNKYLTQEIEGLRAFAVVMPMIFLAVAAAVLNVLLSRLVDQQRTTVGTLKALGYSDRQVFTHFLKFGLAVGVLGGLIGCFLGYWMAEGMTIQYRRFFEFPELTNHFHPGVNFAGMTVSVVCAALGSIRGTRAVLKLRPAEAMRPKPPPRGGAVAIERVEWLWSRLDSGWRMVVRGVVRHRLRTIAGTFAAAMGASVLVSGFMMTEATYYLLDFQFKWVSRSDVDLTFKGEQGEDALLEVARLPGVDMAEPTLAVGCTFINGPYRKKGGITGLIENPQLTIPRDTGARPIRIPSAGLAMSRKLAEILHLKRGDTVEFRTVKGLRRTHRVPIVEISDSYLGTMVYADIEYLSHLIGEEIAMTGAQLKTDGDPASLSAMYAKIKTMPAIQGVSTRTEMVRNMEEEFLSQMWVFIGMLVLFAGIVFFGAILTASLVSLAERQREVATLRVLGYGPWQIGSLLLRESMLVTLLGTLLGMPLGYFLTVLTSYAYDTELFRFPVCSSAATWIWTIVLAVMFALLAHLAVQRTVHRMDWLDALQAKE